MLIQLERHLCDRLGGPSRRAGHEHRGDNANEHVVPLAMTPPPRANAQRESQVAVERMSCGGAEVLL